MGGNGKQREATKGYKRQRRAMRGTGKQRDQREATGENGRQQETLGHPGGLYIYIYIYIYRCLKSLHKHFLMTFVSSETHIYFFLSFRSLVSFCIAQKSDTLFFLSSLAPTLYMNIFRVAKDLLWRFRGVDLEEDDWRQS